MIRNEKRASVLRYLQTEPVNYSRDVTFWEIDRQSSSAGLRKRSGLVRVGDYYADVAGQLTVPTNHHPRYRSITHANLPGADLRRLFDQNGKRSARNTSMTP